MSVTNPSSFVSKTLIVTALALDALVALALAGSNQLSSQEKRDGWRLLFDGADLSEFRLYGIKDGTLERWHIDGDALCLNPRTPEFESKEDLVATKNPVGDFEFSFEWKMSAGGNGGIFYKVVEGDQYPKPWHTGLEMQLLDDEGHKEGLIDTHRAGDMYDLLSARARLAKPVGQWNTSRIVVKGKLVEQWMNGKKALSVRIGSAKWKRAVAKSKYSKLSEFAKSKKGHIVLQDHGDKQWFRNLKIRDL